MQSVNYPVNWTRTEVTLESINHKMAMNVLPVTVLIAIQASVGIIGNILILYIYKRKYKPTTFRQFILTMAAVDLVSCLTTLPGEVYLQMNIYDFEEGWICKWKSYLNAFTAWASGLNLAWLSLDRSRRICRPLERQITPSMALKASVFNICLSAMVAIPDPILWGKQTYEHTYEGVNITISICEKSNRYADEIYPFLYIAFLYILPIGIMMVATTILNVMTARTLFCKRTEVNNSGSPTARPVFWTSSTGNVALLKDRTPSLTSERSPRLSAPAVSHGNDSVLTGSCNQHRLALEEHPHGQEIRPKPKDNANSRLEVGAPFSSSERFRCTTATASCNDLLGALTEVTRPEMSAVVKGTRRKTIIMLVLTSVFVVTMLVYAVLITIESRSEGIVRTLTDRQKVAFFFFLRLYFINSVINPILYGVLDPRFRKGVKELCCRLP